MAFEAATLYANPGTPGFAQNSISNFSDPGSGNDNTQGYSIGSVWLNQTNGKVWQAASVGTGTATWTNTGTLILTGDESPDTLVWLALQTF